MVNKKRQNKIFTTSSNWLNYDTQRHLGREQEYFIYFIVKGAIIRVTTSNKWRIMPTSRQFMGVPSKKLKIAENLLPKIRPRKSTTRATGRLRRANG